MQTRRDFLYNGIGGLARALFPRKKKNACEGVSLDIFIELVEDDIISGQFFLKNERGRKNIVDQLVLPARKLYTEQLGIPITIRSYAPFETFPEPKDGSITVFYGTKRTFLDARYPTMDDLLTIIEHKEQRQKEYEEAASPNKYEEYLRIAVVSDLNDTDGLADIDLKTISLFAKRRPELEDFSEWSLLRIYLRLKGLGLAHELGHMLGLSHAEKTFLKNGTYNIMNTGGNMVDIEDVMQMRYNFSPEDQDILRTLECKTLK